MSDSSIGVQIWDPSPKTMRSIRRQNLHLLSYLTSAPDRTQDTHDLNVGRLRRSGTDKDGESANITLQVSLVALLIQGLKQGDQGCGYTGQPFPVVTVLDFHVLYHAAQT